ncbi:cytochrome [Nesterenkonia sp. HG001]|uniref:cytochrome n=1 Tax=Nesterenkonia sp. HG001 TaxID=2983207 RepID=UPI002AC62F39|nr:cytochrome [Nesterenkonia sp. HG001]MDZ5075958.1 PD-(D/E)XK nuclease family protein [Nesterenkonia sp. HG001]
MTQPTLAHATEFGRMYSRSLTSAPEVPSITTVIGQEPKDLTGWAGHLATTELVQDDRLTGAVGSASQLKTLARHASSAAERFRDAAARRGDRVHHYAEQVALRSLGGAHEAESARAVLTEHGESAFADRFDEWWQLYDVRPIAAEITVWNHAVGYAGTLDLVAEIAGRTCVIDFKTKGLDRRGRAKPLNESVVMQLVAGMQAEERLVDAQAGIWEPWTHGKESLLMAVAISEAEVVPVQASPDALKPHWHKFWALRQVWEHTRRTAEAGPALRPLPPPPAPAAARAAVGAPAPAGAGSPTDAVPPVTPRA